MDSLIPKPTNNTWVLNETITDVNKSAWHAITNKYRNWAIGIVIVSTIWLIAVTLITIFSGTNVSAILYAFFPPVVAYIIFAAVVYTATRHEFYKQFAEANGMSYQKSGSLNVQGALFNLGHTHKTEDIINGFWDNNPLLLFNYQYTVGSGKNQTTYRDTVFQIEYPSPLPPILLVVDRQFFGGITNIFDDWERIKPEGDFDKTFNLYTKKGLELETLQIFGPDFMQKLLTDWPEFNLEFNGNKIIVFHSSTITTKDELQKMYLFVEFLINKLEPKLLRMKSDLEAMKSYTS